MKFSGSVFATTAAVSLSLSSVAAETALQQPEAYQQRLVDWIRSGENGYFHPQVQWKRLGGTGSYAMHTTVDLPKGTPLLVVPRSHIIDSYKTHDDCVTIARMLGEYERGDDSFFAPYLSYLFDDTVGGTGTGLLPASWSEEGKDLLELILGNENGKGLLPRNFIQKSVFAKCGDNFRATHDDEELEDEDLLQQAEDAYLFHLSRSWEDKMVPVLDMYNHRNGESLNVESTIVHSDDDVTAFALRDIKAGEQLQNTYSECMDYDCDFGERKYTYPTTDIITDYGFLEFYPRRWPLNPTNQMIAEVDEDLETGEKSFQWIFETPSETDIEFISDQLSRLRNIEVQVRRAVAKHKTSDAGEPHNNIPHEADSLLEIFEGYVEVLEMALEHKDDPIGVTEAQFRDDLQMARQRRAEVRVEL